jgi:2'-5' RNA ligase
MVSLRLFISAAIPEEVSESVKKLSEKLPKTAKFSVPNNVDLTLKFLGETPDTKLEEVKKRLSAIEFKPFTATVDRIGVFSPKQPRVVWAGVQPAQEFVKLHNNIEKALAGLFPPDKRDYKPHLTVARIKDAGEPKAFLAAVGKIKVKPVSWQMDKFILFLSTLDPRGAMHTPLLEISAK